MLMQQKLQKENIDLWGAILNPPETVFETVHSIQHEHCFWPFQVHTADCLKCFIPLLICEHIDTSENPQKAFNHLLTYISKIISHLSFSSANIDYLIHANSV